MFDRKFGIFLSTFAIGLAFTACSKKDDKKTGGSLQTTFQPSRISQTALHKSSLALASVLPANIALTAPAIGRAEGSDLESLSYRLQSISLCGKLATEGTATQCEEGSFSVYNAADQSVEAYDNFLPENAAADTTNFTNFLDKEALKTLSSGISYSDDNVRSYDSVLVNWFRPFKVKASMTLANGQKIYTKAASEYKSNGKSGLDVTYTSLVADMTSGPAEEGVFFLPNGGTYFRLQKPFEITQADVDNKVNFKVVFAFDPDSTINGSGGNTFDPNSSWLSGMADATNGYRIDAPFLQIAPVIARENETVMREVYLLRAADSSHDVRVSLYSIKEDAEQTIRAVTSTMIYYEQSTTPVDFMQSAAVEKNAAGTYDFKDWMGNNVIGGLKRATNPGQVEGTITHVACAPGSIDSNGCSNGTTTSQYTYSLVAIGPVESDLTIGYQPPEPTGSGSGTP